LGFTYFDKQNKTRSRLDYIFLPENLASLVNSTIIPSFNSRIVDHDLVKATLEVNFNKRGPNYWKLNNLLLEDNNYVEFIKNVIKTCIETYNQ
jgi:hypothetical protein